MDVSKLLGKTLTSVTVNEQNDEILFTDSEGIEYKMYHFQYCCESVYIDDIDGDVQDLVGSPILQAEEVDNSDFKIDYTSSFKEKDEWGNNINIDGDYEPESYTWTFYKFATIKGYVTIRWFGTSNGHYSESVDFVVLGSDEDW